LQIHLSLHKEVPGSLCANISKADSLLQILVASVTQLPLIPSSQYSGYDNGIMGHSGPTMLWCFCGCKILLLVGYAIQSGDEMASTFENFIIHHCIPNALFINNGKSQFGRAIHEILCMYCCIITMLYLFTVYGKL
jgi:hypothetical protein